MIDESWSDLEEDLAADDESEVVPCPECGADVYEDAEQCPACGQYVVHGSRMWSGRPWWWIVLGAAGVGAVVWVLAGQYLARL